MTLTDIRDPILRRENELLGRIIDDLLRAPYLGNQAWAISAACAVRHHPRVKQQGKGGCSCGRVP